MRASGAGFGGALRIHAAWFAGFVNAVHKNRTWPEKQACRRLAGISKIHAKSQRAMLNWHFAIDNKLGVITSEVLRVNGMEEDIKTFEELVPHGEEAFMVLKAQLLAEHSLAQYVRARVPSMAVEIEDRNSPVRSGLALIMLAQALSLRDEIPPACSDKLWPALKLLNTLRNDLAHNLFPNSNKIIGRMKEFIRIVRGEPVKAGENLNRSFRQCALALIAYLAIDRQPFTLADTE